MQNNLTQKQVIPFTQIPNSLLNDINLSLKSKGLYSFMFSKPNGWNFTIRSMSKQLKEGTDSIGNSLKELKKYGWVTYTKKTNGSGVYKLLYASNLTISPNTENPNLGNPNMGKPERISNTDLNSNKDYNKISAKADGIDFNLLLMFINKSLNRKFRVINNKSKAQYKARLKEGYTKEDIMLAVKNSIQDDFNKKTNYKYLTPEYFSRGNTIERFSQKNTSIGLSIKEQTAHIKNNVGKNSI